MSWKEQLRKKIEETEQRRKIERIEREQAKRKIREEDTQMFKEVLPRVEDVVQEFLKAVSPDWDLKTSEEPTKEILKRFDIRKWKSTKYCIIIRIFRRNITHPPKILVEGEEIFVKDFTEEKLAQLLVENYVKIEDSI